MLKIFHRTIKDSKSSMFKEFRPNTWVYSIDPDEEDLEKISIACHLNKDLLHDALDPFEVPRIETDDNATYVFTRGPIEENDLTSTSPILIAIGKNHIVTVSKSEMCFLKKFADERIEFSTTQRIKLFVQLFSELNKAYNDSMTRILKKVRIIGVSFEKITTKDIIQFVDFERIINDFLSALIPTNNILHNLLSDKHLRLYEKDIDLIEDLFLNNKQLIEICNSTLKNIVNIRDAYSTVMTQDTNRTIKILTSLTILLTVPTIISSIYGMNVELPFADSPLAFLGIMIATVLIAYALIAAFTKRNWL